MGSQVSANYLDVLSVRMAAGRGFANSENRSSEPVTVVSEALARRLFGNAASAVDHLLTVNGVPCTITGVVGEPFRGEVPGLNVDIWVLIQQFRPAEDLANRSGSFFQVIGRLRNGVSHEQAAQFLSALYARAAAPEAATLPPAITTRGAAQQISVVDGSRGIPLLAQRFEQSFRSTDPSQLNA